MTQQEAEATVELIRELEAKKDRLQDFIDGMKDKVKAFMSEQGATSIRLGSFKVSWTEFETTRFDTKSFKNEHKDLYKQYEIKSTVKRFTIN